MLADLQESADRLDIAGPASRSVARRVFAQLGQEAEEESETLLPLDASAIALDFGGGGNDDESLDVGLLSANEGDVDVDGAVGGMGGFSGGGRIGGFSGAAAAVASCQCGRGTPGLVVARARGYARAPASTAFLCSHRRSSSYSASCWAPLRRGLLCNANGVGPSPYAYGIVLHHPCSKGVAAKAACRAPTEAVVTVAVTTSSAAVLEKVPVTFVASGDCVQRGVGYVADGRRHCGDVHAAGRSIRWRDRRSLRPGGLRGV